MASALNRIEEKLKKSKSNANFYEAHQLYTTLYYRYNSKQKYEDARKLMVDGAKYLFENDQTGSGAHLSLLYVESLEKNVKDVADNVISTIAELHSLMPVEMPEMEQFERRAVLWSASCTDMPKTGDRQLRKLLAITYWKNKMYAEARQNFLYSDDGHQFGNMLQEFSIKFGFPGETDLFLTQAVLQLLCLQSYQVACQVFSSYTQLHPKVGKGPPFEYPLINFISFLLIAVEKKQLTVFTILCNEYQVSLQRDVLYIGYLEKIAQHYFGVAAAKTQPKAGLFQNLLQSLFNEEDEIPKEEVKPKETRTMTIEDLD